MTLRLILLLAREGFWSAWAIAEAAKDLGTPNYFYRRLLWRTTEISDRDAVVMLEICGLKPSAIKRPVGVLLPHQLLKAVRGYRLSVTMQELEAALGRGNVRLGDGLYIDGGFVKVKEE